MFWEISFEGLACSHGNGGVGCYYTPSALRAFDGTSITLKYRHREFLESEAQLQYTPGGLRARGSFFLNDSDGREADLLRLIRAGMIRALSIAFEQNETSAWDISPKVHNSIRLLELSLCEQGMDPAACITKLTYRAVSPDEVNR